MYKCLSGLISYLSNELPVIAYIPYTWLHPKDDAMHECIDSHNKNTIIQITLQFLVTHPRQSISLSVQRSSQLCPSGVNRLIVLCCVLYCIVPCPSSPPFRRLMQTLRKLHLHKSTSCQLQTWVANCCNYTPYISFIPASTSFMTIHWDACTCLYTNNRQCKVYWSAKYSKYSCM